MSTSNIHKYSLFVNIVPKYVETEVTIINNVGNVPEAEYYSSATAEYIDRIESIEITNKEFYLFGTNQSEYLAESLEDLEEITTNYRNFGDIAYIVDGEYKGKLYITNGNMDWTEQ